MKEYTNCNQECTIVCMSLQTVCKKNTDLDSIEAVPDLLDLLSFGTDDLPVEALVNDDVLCPFVLLPRREHTFLSKSSEGA